MTPETRERFAVLVERRLAGLLGDAETAELSRLLETSEVARELYFRAVEFHLDLRRAMGQRAIPEKAESRHTPKVVVRPPKRKLDAALLAAAGFLVVVAIGYRTLRESSPQEESATLPRERALPGVNMPPGPATATPKQRSIEADLPPTPRPIDPRIEELKRGVFANIWLTNMTGLISECMRYRNLTAEWRQLQADMGIYDGKIKHNLEELAKVGERPTIEHYLSPGDQIIGFAQRDFTTMKPGEAAALIQEWVSKWSAGPSLEQVTFVRNEKRWTIYLEFPEETKELLSLVRNPALTPGAFATESVPIPAELIKDINGRFDALPAGYRGLLVGIDRTKIDELMKTRKGTPEDIEWLKSRILGEAMPAFQRDADMIQAKVLELEPKLKENATSDVIIFKDGRRVEGQILQETTESVKLKSRFGSVLLSKGDIQKIEKGKGVALDFPIKLAEAMKPAQLSERLEKLEPLLVWCVEKNLKDQKEYTAYRILTLDASHEKARAAVGLARPAFHK